MFAKIARRQAAWWIVFLSLALPGIAMADNGRQSTVAELSAAWWQWIYSLPIADDELDSHPLNAVGDVDCSVGQHGSVWFLAGTTGGAAVRNCTVPKGKKLFFPLVNSAFVNGPGENFTVQEKRDALSGTLDLSCFLTATVNGVSVVQDGILISRTQSRPFHVLVENNIFADFNVPIGTMDDEVISDGFWVLLPKLPKGEHVVQFTGAICIPDIVFEVDVTYNITVVKGRRRGHRDHDHGHDHD